MLIPVAQAKTAASKKIRQPSQVAEATLLSQSEREKIDIKKLKAMDQAQLDHLYARLEPGPIPTGDFEGSILVRDAALIATEEQMLKKLKGLTGLLAKLAAAGFCLSRDRIECAGELLWSGKRFYAPQADGTVQLRNAISPRLRSRLLLEKAGLAAAKEPLDAIQAEPFGSKKNLHLMLFPSHVYCGHSLVDRNRQAVIIDYAHGDRFKPYIPAVDGLAGRDWLQIRDEIRLVKPGLYLGRAYVGEIFLLNFLLENKEQTKKTSDPGSWRTTCFAGPTMET